MTPEGRKKVEQLIRERGKTLGITLEPELFEALVDGILQGLDDAAWPPES